MSITESYMKQQLDGWFVKYDPSADKFTLKRVPKDFMPRHESHFALCIAAARRSWEKPGRKPGGNYKRIPTPEQADLVRKYLAQGMTKSRIYVTMQTKGHNVSYSGIKAIMEAAQ